MCFSICNHFITGFSLVVARGGYSLAAVNRRLIVMAPFAADVLKHRGLAPPQHVGSSPTKDWTHVSCISRQSLYCWATKEALFTIFYDCIVINYTKSLSFEAHQSLVRFLMVWLVCCSILILVRVFFFFFKRKRYIKKKRQLLANISPQRSRYLERVLKWCRFSLVSHTFSCILVMEPIHRDQHKALSSLLAPIHGAW